MASNRKSIKNMAIQANKKYPWANLCEQCLQPIGISGLCIGCDVINAADPPSFWGRRRFSFDLAVEGL